jgi:tetratricopeptide (TPR) repeat protein
MALSKLAVIPQELLSTLSRDIDSRRIQHGMHRLANIEQILEAFSPGLENAAAFLGSLAQWCDIGYGDATLVKRLLATYDHESRCRLSIAEYVHVRMAEGMVAMTEDVLESAIEHFDVVLKIAVETRSWEVLAIANYWKARCQRKRGQYESALSHVRQALEIQAAHGHVQNEVPARVLESLILFENGDSPKALKKLRAAESILIKTDDYSTLGNIQSTYGRILQRESRFGQAIEHYTRAIEHFQKGDSMQSNVARAIVDLSFTRIQVARHFRRNIDVSRDSRQTERQHGPERVVLVKELSNSCAVIVEDLKKAEEIYRQHPHARGVSRVHLCRAYLYLDTGELDAAAEAAKKGYAAAETKQDFILMSSARKVQCMVENALVEEEVEGWADHAVSAQDYARDAVELAESTQDRRLLATAYTWFGLTMSNAFFGDKERAREAMEKAATYLEPGLRDYLWNDFQTLKRRLLENATLESKLMQWAQGEIGEKTFRQLEDEFASLVIPRAWEQERKKVSRVATRLSISPRKVRKVLARLGLLETEAAAGAEVPEKVEPVELKPKVALVQPKPRARWQRTRGKRARKAN